MILTLICDDLKQNDDAERSLDDWLVKKKNSLLYVKLEKYPYLIK